MRLLLDSHVVLWYDDRGLPADAAAAIRSAEAVFVSAVTFWELSIKGKSTGRDFHMLLTASVERHGFQTLLITPEHGVTAGSLPLHHRDPFDRMLVAQAKVEELTLVTHDRTLQQYGIPLLLA